MKSQVGAFEVGRGGGGEGSGLAVCGAKKSPTTRGVGLNGTSRGGYVNQSPTARIYTFLQIHDRKLVLVMRRSTLYN
jgi:hypothetical protein